MCLVGGGLRGGSSDQFRIPETHHKQRQTRNGGSQSRDRDPHEASQDQNEGSQNDSNVENYLYSILKCLCCRLVTGSFHLKIIKMLQNLFFLL